MPNKHLLAPLILSRIGGNLKSQGSGSQSFLLFEVDSLLLYAMQGLSLFRAFTSTSFVLERLTSQISIHANLFHDINIILCIFLYVFGKNTIQLGCNAIMMIALSNDALFNTFLSFKRVNR